MAAVSGNVCRNSWRPCAPSSVSQAPRAVCPKLHYRARHLVPCRAAQEEETAVDLSGEDAAAFSAEEQTVDQWTRFFLVLGVVSGVEVRSTNYSHRMFQKSFNMSCLVRLFLFSVMLRRGSAAVRWRCTTGFPCSQDVRILGTAL